MTKEILDGQLDFLWFCIQKLLQKSNAMLYADPGLAGRSAGSLLPQSCSGCT